MATAVGLRCQCNMAKVALCNVNDIGAGDAKKTGDLTVLVFEFVTTSRVQALDTIQIATTM